MTDYEAVLRALELFRSYGGNDPRIVFSSPSLDRMVTEVEERVRRHQEEERAMEELLSRWEERLPELRARLLAEARPLAEIPRARLEETVLVSEEATRSGFSVCPPGPPAR